MKTRQKAEESIHFAEGLQRCDPLLAGILNRERARQASQIELIASENMVSQSVL